MPKTTVCLRMASTYFFWPTVLGLMERPRVVRTESPKTTEGRASPSPWMMSMERPTVSAVRASPRSSRVMSSSKRRATRSASACSPVMVISLPRTKTVLSKAASISLSSSSRVPRRLTIEWFPGTSTLTWTCVGCCTLAVSPSVWGRRRTPTAAAGGFPSIASRSSGSQVGDRDRVDLVGQVEAEHAAVEVELGFQGPADVGRLAEAVLLAREGQVGVRDGLGVEGGGHHLGLGRGDDLVLKALEQDDRAGQAVGEVDRRPLPVQRLGLRPGADEAVQVAGLELVGVAGQPGQVGHPVVAGPGGEGVAEGEGAQGGVAAGAAAPDGQVGRVDVAPVGQVAGGGDAVVDVDDPPLAVQATPVGAAVAGGAAVVDVHHGDAPAGEELVADVQGAGDPGGGAAVAGHDQRRPLPLGALGVAVGRRVVQGVGGAAALGGELDRLGHGEVAG